MTHLVLSLDYEVFGNGAGDVRRDVVQPTRRLLDICNRHGARLTIMFEAGEYWAFEQYDARLQEDLGYSPCMAMKTQILDAIQCGHDVQLHLHPQWLSARYEQGVWQLGHCGWRLADLPDGLGSPDQALSITGALGRGKRTLEEMLRPVRADYACVCFRAGGFCAQPARDIIRAMKTVGLRADSSVVKGYRTTRPFAVDYSRVATQTAAWWTTGMEFTEEGAPGENILELSVSARIEPYWNSFKPAKLRAALHRRRIERASRQDSATGAGCGVSSVPSGRVVWQKMLSKHASTFDFCKLSCRDMLQRLRDLEDERQQPVVLIGHSKDFLNDRQFEEFLGALSRRGGVRFATMSEIIRERLRGPGSSKSVEPMDAGVGR